VHATLEEEQPRLLALPEHPWNSDLVKPVASGKQPYIRFDRNDEAQDRARRSLERRLGRSQLGRFKPMADFDWA
jgi:hypothetical protein